MHEPLRTHGNGAARRPGARGRLVEPTARRCTTRQVGPGRPPRRWSKGLTVARPRCSRDGKVLVVRLDEARSCTTPKRGLDRHWGDEQPSVQATWPRCCPTARCSWRAGGSVGHGIHPSRTRPRSTTPSRGPGPRSRTCRRRTFRCTGATLLPDGKVLVYSRDGIGGLRPDHRNMDRICDADRVHARSRGTAVGWHRADGRIDGQPLGDDPGACTAALFDPRTGSLTTTSSMLRCGDESSFTLLLDGTVLKAGGRDCNDERQCLSNGAAELYVPAGVSLPPFSFPSPPRWSSRARPRSRRRSRPRPVPSRRTLGAGRSRSTTKAPSRRSCSSPRTRAGYGSSGRRLRTWSQPAPPCR